MKRPRCALAACSRPVPEPAELPEELKELIERSGRLEERVRHLDIGMGGRSFGIRAPVSEPAARDALADQMARLSAAFQPSDKT